ncbi:MAG TPA: malto-oligosyltrehalose trehalohydrolase [Casimicrobiaceae bacterium]|nr:malto-oligosyltrehalose trehalohydrolase [Casimicrobiaceae bacterium]
MNRVYRMPFGAEVRGSSTRFRLWAPGAPRVDLVFGAAKDGPMHTMQRNDDGFFEATTEAPAGTRYAFRIDDDLVVPDPASRYNPDDVHAPSEVVDPEAYRWNDADWRGRPWHEAVVYELHVGTFTRRGSYAGVEDRLDDLRDLGITAIELMPLSDFPGRCNWGYDGVLPFAPDASYGTPDDLKRLIDAAHARSMMVLLDVVYNHFGPEGNYLHAYAPQFFNPRHHTPWGAAINFDGEHSRFVRDFFVHNALYWLTEFHLDGLRLDAVHAIADDSRPDIVDEIAAEVVKHAGNHRHVHLVLENDRNEARRLRRSAHGKPRLATAQWNDDIHHALHVAVTGERDGYYADYANAPLQWFARALAEGFVYQGQPSPYRDGAARGEPSDDVAPIAFVNFAQNHDQIGNRAFGERIGAIADEGRLRTAIACLLLAPAIPMLFMGEEFAASAPFLFFCDFGDELAAAVTKGRRDEFGRFARFRDPAVRQSIPDPNAMSTFKASTLDWNERQGARGKDMLAFYRRCLTARRDHVVPLLSSIVRGGRHELSADMLHVAWPLGDTRRLSLDANFGASEAISPCIADRLLFATEGGLMPQSLVPAHAVRLGVIGS